LALRRPNEFLGPNGLGLSPDGNFLFVADTNNHRIRKFDIGGETPIAVADFRDPTDPLPGETDENGETLEPHFFPLDVAITAAGEIVMVELLPQVQVWSATGEVLHTWGTFGAGPSQFNIPAGILVDGSDNIYVSDTLNGRLQKFDLEGQFLLQWGREGERAARLNAPLRAALAPDGILYVCDGPSAFLNQNRIVAYRLFPTAVQTETWSGIRQRFR
jgi:sugar lactone lactonase YvrE